MNTETSRLSPEFARLYCDPAAYDWYSILHPVNLRRVLPFQPEDEVVDDAGLLCAENAHLAERNDDTRRAIVEAYARCELLPEEEAANLKSAIDFFDTDFFELMGLLYANAGMFKCALRWYREQITELEANRPNSRSDSEGVYASVGYCLYALGMFEEAISWTKSCIGPRPVMDAVSRALIGYEAEAQGGALYSVERSGPGTRFTFTTPDPDPGHARSAVLRLKGAIQKFAPFQNILMDWSPQNSTDPGPRPEGNPFRRESDGGSLPRHKMNWIFSACCQADVLVERRCVAEAGRVLTEAAMLEPAADIIQERLQGLA
jgi:tetratricopeptide (TPR) repeat protein